MQRRPDAIPIANDTTRIIKNFNKILKTVPAVIEVYSFPPKIFKTDLKRIIATASFTIPSPKTIENSLGYF